MAGGVEKKLCCGDGWVLALYWAGFLLDCELLSYIDMYW